MPTRYNRAALAFVSLLFAQTSPDAVNTRSLRADLQYLCSTRLQGRLSLSRGADAAAGYIASEFKKAGLAPGAGTAGHFGVRPVPNRKPKALPTGG